MSPAGLSFLLVVFFLTAVISVVTGGTSLITVPVMIQVGIDPHVAVATNMVSLIFLSLGGTLPFVKSPALRQKRLPALVGLTLIGSILGAFLLLIVPSKAMPVVIGIAMIVVVLFSVMNPHAGVTRSPDRVSRRREALGYVATFLLGVYGGFFSGGYVALLTAAYVAFFRLTFLDAVAITKVLNVVSSLVAVAIFTTEGIIDWPLSLPLSVVSFLGAIVGAVVARRMTNVWLRRVFLTAVIALAAKTLLYDGDWASIFLAS
jgi:uncharacterized membrane protein YfcA